MKIKKWTGLLEALMVASLVTLMPIGSAQAEVSGVTEIRLWHVLLAISFFFAILTFSYPLVMRIRRKRQEEREEERIEEKEMRREEEVMKILREIEELKDKIERRGMKLTSRNLSLKKKALPKKRRKTFLERKFYQRKIQQKREKI
ncbi:MAG: hypothetical protein KAU16_02990 [Methanophagales archaeon]|nr:hypothetical protein [Methanophagales archaeon]